MSTGDAEFYIEGATATSKEYKVSPLHECVVHET